MFNLYVLVPIFVVTFAIYFFDLRRECRWVAGVAAVAATGCAYAIGRYVADESLAQLLLKGTLLAMVALSIPARYWFGNNRRTVYREHHIKATRFLPW